MNYQYSVSMIYYETYYTYIIERITKQYDIIAVEYIMMYL